MSWLIIALCILCLGSCVLYSILNRLFRWNRTRNLEYLVERVFPLLDNTGIRYWLDFGTLLGAWRTGRVIPYDYDVDVSVHADQLPLVEQLLESLPGGLFLKGKKSGIWYKIRARRRLCSLDIYVYHDLPDGTLCQSFACVEEAGQIACVPFQCYGMVNRDLIFPLKKGTLDTIEGPRSVALPNNTDAYLKQLYDRPDLPTHRGYLGDRFFFKKTLKARKWTFE